MTALGLLFTLAACSSQPTLPKGAIGSVSGFIGGVVADEPRAALIGQEMLSRGGSAADAAAAMYFTMAVTLPSRAGLGGGGMCLAYEGETGRAEVLDFTATAPSNIPATSDRPSAVPGNPRGFYALQARLGKLQWRQVVAPAEKLARFGHPVSRAFARDLQSIGPAILGDANARAMFANASGSAVAAEGDTIEQVNLAATLASLRARGVGPFYTGPLARNFVDQVKAAGGSLSMEDLRAFTPKWRQSVRVYVGSDVAHFAPPPASASTVAAMIFAAAIEDGGFDGQDAGGQAHMMADLGLRAFADRESWLNASGQATRPDDAIVTPQRTKAVLQGYRDDTRTPVARFALPPRNRHETPSATGFTAADVFGNAVSCVVSMNAAFGTGRVASGTGVLLAAAPSNSGRGPIGIAPMMVVNENSKVFRFAAAASGGVTAPSALAQVAARVLLDDQPLSQAVAAPRVHLSGDPDVTYVEPSLGADAQRFLAGAGHRVVATPVIGQVNGLYCPNGLLEGRRTCQMTNDPRGVGLAVGSMQK